jgi:hypothetical protein
MFNWIYRFWAWLAGVNADSTPVALIAEQLNEPRPLPIGRYQFDEWSGRIMSGVALQVANLDTQDTAEQLQNGQKFALCSMLMHLGPTESHKPDAYFIHQLRKSMVNQTAHQIATEIKEADKAFRKSASTETSTEGTNTASARPSLVKSESDR